MFSVIIPLFNKQATIARAIQSVVNQTVPVDEIIVVDDGSTDEGVRVIRTLDHPDIQIIHQTNQGVSAARNRGMAVAQSQFICFLDADDQWMPDYMKTVQALTRQCPSSDVFATRYYIQSAHSQPRLARINGLSQDFSGELRGYFQVAILSDPPIHTSAVCIRKCVLTELGGFPVGITSGEDLLTWARLAVRSSIAYSMSPQTIFHLPKGHAYHESPNRLPDHPDRVGLELERLYTATPSKALKAYIALWHKMRASCFLRCGMRRATRNDIVRSLQWNWQTKGMIYYMLSFMPEIVIRKAFAWGGHS